MYILCIYRDITDVGTDSTHTSFPFPVSIDYEKENPHFPRKSFFAHDFFFASFSDDDFYTIFFPLRSTNSISISICEPWMCVYRFQRTLLERLPGCNIFFLARLIGKTGCKRTHTFIKNLQLYFAVKLAWLSECFDVSL